MYEEDGPFRKTFKNVYTKLAVAILLVLAYDVYKWWGRYSLSLMFRKKHAEFHELQEKILNPRSYTISANIDDMTSMEKYILQREIDRDTVADSDEDSQPLEKPPTGG